MTTTQLYDKFKAGEITREKFLYEVRRDVNLINKVITNVMNFDDTVRVLKHRGLILEAAKSKGTLTIDQVNPYEYRKGLDYELELCGKAVSNWGVDFTGDSDYAKSIKKVLQNLTKDPLYYTHLVTGQQKDDSQAMVELNKKKDNVVDKKNAVKPVSKVKVKSNVKVNLGKKEAKKGKPKGVKEMTIIPKKSKGVKVMDIPKHANEFKWDKVKLSHLMPSKKKSSLKESLDEYGEDSGGQDLHWGMYRDRNPNGSPSQMPSAHEAAQVIAPTLPPNYNEKQVEQAIHNEYPEFWDQISTDDEFWEGLYYSLQSEIPNKKEDAPVNSFHQEEEEAGMGDGMNSGMDDGSNVREGYEDVADPQSPDNILPFSKVRPGMKAISNGEPVTVIAIGDYYDLKKYDGSGALGDFNESSRNDTKMKKSNIKKIKKLKKIKSSDHQIEVIDLSHDNVAKIHPAGRLRPHRVLRHRRSR
jgi:hypothetical protein